MSSICLLCMSSICVLCMSSICVLCMASICVLCMSSIYVFYGGYYPSGILSRGGIVRELLTRGILTRGNSVQRGFAPFCHGVFWPGVLSCYRV